MRKFVCLIVVVCVIVSTVSTALASPPHAASQLVLPEGDKMNDKQLEQVKGEFGPIVAGALVGAVGETFHYTTKPGKKSWRGFGKSVATGAAWGAALATVGLAGAIATGAKTAVSAASVAWAAWGNANIGALRGASEQF